MRAEKEERKMVAAVMRYKLDITSARLEKAGVISDVPYLVFLVFGHCEPLNFKLLQYAIKLV